MEIIIMLMLPLIGALIFGIIYYSIMKKRADAVFPIRRLINSNKWHITGRYHLSHINGGVHIRGYYKDRFFTCRYGYGVGFAFKFCIEISVVPKVVPKKIPWYKMSYPIMYKNYVLAQNSANLGSNIVSTTAINLSDYGGKLSEEKCKELLDDVVHACEIVERGEYEIE